MCPINICSNYKIRTSLSIPFSKLVKIGTNITHTVLNFVLVAITRSMTQQHFTRHCCGISVSQSTMRLRGQMENQDPPASIRCSMREGEKQIIGPIFFFALTGYRSSSSDNISLSVRPFGDKLSLACNLQSLSFWLRSLSFLHQALGTKAVESPRGLQELYQSIALPL